MSNLTNPPLDFFLFNISLRKEYAAAEKVRRYDSQRKHFPSFEHY